MRTSTVPDPSRPGSSRPMVPDVVPTSGIATVSVTGRDSRSGTFSRIAPSCPKCLVSSESENLSTVRPDFERLTHIPPSFRPMNRAVEAQNEGPRGGRR